MDFKTISLPNSVQEHILTKDILYFREITSLEEFENIKQIEALAILIVNKGKITINVNEQQIIARKHDLISLPFSLIKHGNISNGTFECSMIALSKNFMFGILSITRIKWSNLENIKQFNPLIHLDDNILQIMHDYNRLFYHRLTLQNSDKYDRSTSSLVLAMLSDLFSYCKQNGYANLDESKEPVRQSDVIFKRFIALINQTIADSNSPSRSIQYYADSLNVSPKYLTHVCKTCSGETAKSIIGHVLEKRIDHLLLHSDLSIKEIAVKLGFPDVSNFGRYVKSKLGKSPRAIRASIKS